MEVILREDVTTLGRRGDVVKVAEGYGRNYLVPRGLAMAVTDSNKAMIDKEKRAHAARAAKETSEFDALAQRIAGLRFIAPRKVGENEQLYGSVTSGDVGDFLKGKGIDLDKRKVQLEDPIKKLGDYAVPLKLHLDVVTNVKVKVVAEGARPSK